jgi:hypothetical protein
MMAFLSKGLHYRDLGAVHGVDVDSNESTVSWRTFPPQFVVMKFADTMGAGSCRSW